MLINPNFLAIKHRNPCVIWGARISISNRIGNAHLIATVIPARAAARTPIRGMSGCKDIIASKTAKKIGIRITPIFFPKFIITRSRKVDEEISSNKGTSMIKIPILNIGCKREGTSHYECYSPNDHKHIRITVNLLFCELLNFKESVIDGIRFPNPFIAKKPPIPEQSHCNMQNNCKKRVPTKITKWKANQETTEEALISVEFWADKFNLFFRNSLGFLSHCLNPFASHSTRKPGEFLMLFDIAKKLIFCFSSLTNKGNDNVTRSIQKSYPTSSRIE